MADTFRCTIVTPERQVFDEDLAYATIPAHDGQLGVAPGRAPMLVELGFGPAVLRDPGGAERAIFLGGGFAQMKAGVLTLLADEASRVSEIDTEAARADLEEALASRATSDAQQATRRRRIDRARALLAASA